VDHVDVQAVDREAGDPAIGPIAARVLVIDDDPEVRKFLVDSCETFGFSVSEAQDGYSGLSALANTSPDLAIIDYAMPGLTGTEVAREARLQQPNLPIVFASGYAETAAIQKIQDENTSVLRKP